MKKGKMIYEGKAKKIYKTDDPDLFIQHFKDDATAFNAKKRGTIVNKGVMNNKISERLFRLLESEGVPTHFVERPNARDMIVKRLEIVPVEVVVRNVIAGSMSKRLNIPEGTKAKKPIIEFYYKSDALDDPLVNTDTAVALGWATAKELATIKAMAKKVDSVLTRFFDERGILLVDFKLEFGRHNGQILLGDEICPDTCRLWDKKTMAKMDKDRFRRDLGNVEEAYQEVCKRVCE
ncbi:MAG: phosphoribosylaminoimidazolesuccinocarboxamide synthase [Nitrospirae bacterium]|nr:phosphoribosylaminoimidazolesuccinocarboxamide synthase [Nitrospirota bacterium]